MNRPKRTFEMPVYDPQFWDIVEGTGKNEAVIESGLSRQVAEQRLLLKQQEFGTSITFKMRKQKKEGVVNL